MTIMADDLALEVQESRPPNPAMREAARFAHFLRDTTRRRDSYAERAEHDQQIPVAIAEFWRIYGERYPQERFREVFVRCEEIRAVAADRRWLNWERRRNAYLLTLRAKDISYDVHWKRRMAWERRNPPPATRLGDRSIVSVEFCDECQLPKPTPLVIVAGTLRGVDYDLCAQCYRDNYTTCGRCGLTHRNDAEHYHPPPPRRGSKCRAPRERFRMPNVLLKSGYQPCDRVVAVKTANALQVSASALTSVLGIINGQDEVIRSGWYFSSENLRYVIANNELDWEVAGKGKFPKRIASGLYKRYRIKLSPEAISEIGNVTRQSLTDASDHYVEFTKQLDDISENFMHGDSCWWNQEARHRCLLKENGGMAMRLFSSGEYRRGELRGKTLDNLIARAWLVPVDEHFFTPVHDPMQAYGFLLFNAYGRGGTSFGNSAGQPMSAVLASVLGMKYVTYTSSFHCRGMYINDGGYLITPERVTENREVRFSIIEHDLQCSCITHKKDTEPPIYEYDDGDWSPAVVGGDTPPVTATNKYSEDEEPEDNDRAAGGGNHRSVVQWDREASPFFFEEHEPEDDS